jgi:hypothetical protein
MTDREKIIDQLKRTTVANGGVPLSTRAFFKETGLGPRDLHRCGWPTHGALLQSQGLARGTMRQAYSDDELFRPLAQLTRVLGHFPTQNEREVERHREPAFPSSEAYLRRARGASLEVEFVDWCRRSNAYPDLVAKLSGSIVGAIKQRRPAVRGYVYMMRSGRRHKIGRETTEGARQAAAGTWLEDPRVVHRIATDDPEGVERYWHERFRKQNKLVKGELYDLTAADVAAFKAWKRLI